MSERTRYTFRGHHHNFLLLLVAMDSLLLLFLAVAVTVAGDPTPSPNPARVGPEGHGNVDPHQLTALHSLGYPTSNLLDPCTANSTTVSATCDSAAPFRHVTTLHLANCSTDIAVSGAALAALSPTLRSLSFSSCPAAAPRHLPPPPLAASLRSFSAVSSLRHLSALWLSHLSGLYSLIITGTPIVSSASNDCLAVVVSQMRNLTTLTLSNANLSGLLPRHWHCADHLARLDLSMNRFTGRIPSSITLLGSLQHLNLSSNSLAGSIPASIGDMIALQNASFANNSLSGEIPISVSRLTELVHLDLGSNRFNGSLPGFLSKIRGLRVLNLENNDFHGVIPFNATFLASLESFRVAGNSKLCYNRTVLSSKLKLGIAPCDKYGYPVSPPPERTARSDKSTDYSEDGDGSGGGGGHRGPNPLVLGVAIGLSCLVFLVILLVCLSKVCG